MTGIQIILICTCSLAAFLVVNIVAIWGLMARVGSLEEALRKVSESLQNDYWTKKVIQRSLMRGPLEPSASSYEEWVAKQTKENIIHPPDIRKLNESMLRHDCGFKDIIAYDCPKTKKVGYSCECGVKWQMEWARMKCSVASLPVEQAEQISQLIKSAVGRELLGKQLSTKRLKSPEELNPMGDMDIVEEEFEPDLDMSFALDADELEE